jgi:hypothetical protein
MPDQWEALDVLSVWQLNDPGHQYPELAILRALTAGAKQLAEDHAVLLKFLNAEVVSKPGRSRFFLRQHPLRN